MTLKVDNISKSYSDKLILDGLSFEIAKGEIVGLLGKNGAGKTTLLKLIAGITKSKTGSITSGSTKPSIGYLSERNPLYPEMYIPEYLHLVSSISNDKKINLSIEKVIQKVGLEDVIHKKISQLSKGYRQRVGLAAAMISNPDILILDEPINGLDPAQINDYRAVVKELGQDRIVMLSSHLMQEVEAICDRVILIEDGRVVKDFYISQKQTQWSIILEVEQQLDIGIIEEIHEVAAIDELSEFIYSITANEDCRLEIFDAVVSQSIRIRELKLNDNQLKQLF